MSTSRERRILKELADMEADRQNTGVVAHSVSERDFGHLRGFFPGPPDTPYAGANFVVDIHLPGQYPFRSPVIKFQTKIWHPNVSSQTGAICLDILGNNWSPVQTIKTALISLRMLLENPNPKDPQDAEVAKMLMEDPATFATKAQEWAIRYAGAPRADLDLSKYKKAQEDKNVDEKTRYQGYSKDLVSRFVSMGFSVEDVVEAFSYVGIDHNNGEDYVLEEAYMGDVTARLLGEQ